ncbi:MAG: DUF4011 domain-containing protein, partial [Abditibacteriota bacterium]|nr:DUF4011 domain-containing protein [Abditibacteriota bacterium]
ARGRQIEKDNEALRSAVEDFNKNGSYDKYRKIAEMLWDSVVCVPLKMALSEEAEAVLAAASEREGKTFTAEEDAVLKKGMEPCPMTVKGKDGRQYFFVFTSEKEIGDNLKYDIAHPDPFPRVVAMILNLEHKPDTVVLNPFTQSFEIETKVLKAMLALKSGDRELLKEVAEKVEAEEKAEMFEDHHEPVDPVALRKAIEDFRSHKSDGNFRAVVDLIMDRKVFLPAKVEMSEEALKLYHEAKEKGADALPENAREIMKDSFKPLGIVQGKAFFVTVFSSPDKVDEDFGHDTLLDTSFERAMRMALEYYADGIVLDPYTQPFDIDAGNMKKILEERYGSKKTETAPTASEPAETPASSESPQTPEAPPASKAPKAELTSDFNSGDGISMEVDMFDLFNFALYQNDIPLIRGIKVLNATRDPMEGLVLTVKADGDFMTDYRAELPPIPAGKPVELERPRLPISGSFLGDLTEAVNKTVSVELVKEDKTLCRCDYTVKIYAYDQYIAGSAYLDLLPAFVLPNHPLIPVILHDATEILKKWRKDPILEGYQSGDPNRVRDLAAAVYGAVQKMNIVYSNPPASFFTVPGQRIRTPETIAEQHFGTCMDMTLLYAACLENIGLHPLLVLMTGQIYAGVWLRERSFEEIGKSNPIIGDPRPLLKRIDNGADELTFIECTAMCSGINRSFEEAEKAAKFHNLADVENFEYAIDVQCARLRGINPMAFRVKDSGVYHIDVKKQKDSDITSAPKSLGLTSVEIPTKGGKKVMTKKDLWESKLLDLTGRNMLLNLPQKSSSIMPLMSAHVDEIEDALADGHEFHILPEPMQISSIKVPMPTRDGKMKEVNLLDLLVKENGIFEITEWPTQSNMDISSWFRQEFRNHRMYAFRGQTVLNKELTSMYRAARASQQENGTSSLYLAIGLLRWFQTSGKSPMYAPLILLPIEIVRKPGNLGYALHARDDEPHFNTTLLEMLKRDYNIEVHGVDPLPTDDHGVDIKKVFAAVRGSVYNMENWDVVESCVIGNFSFAKFAMWNDIHSAGDMLENSKVVRSLMKGHVDWDVTVVEDEGEDMYLPITVDDTQLTAIKMAAAGNTFVLHGPPGTGKSQTITAMIANLMARGKKVLFVAEKMAALSVVQKRLASLGIGDFCLELHSDKANKRQVLTQLEKALAIKRPERRSEYAEQTEAAAEARKRLDGYAKHLHAARNCGRSLRDLIDMYEEARSADKEIEFDVFEVGKVTAEDMKKHISLIGRLTAAGSVMGDIKNNPMKGMMLTSYEAETRVTLRAAAENHMNAVKAMESAGKAAAALLKTAEPTRKTEYGNMLRLVNLFTEDDKEESALLRLAEKCLGEITGYFDKEKSLRDTERTLLKRWKKEFLSENIPAYLEKHETAGKKFFRKSAAMDAVVEEIQRFALCTLSYDSLPPMLREIEAYQAEENRLESARAALSPDALKVLEKFPTLKDYEGALKMAEGRRARLAAFPGGAEAVSELRTNPEAVKVLGDYKKNCLRFAETAKAFNELTVRQNADGVLEDEIALCRYICDHPAAPKDWALYN